jgi:hypothetical protein
MALVGAMTAMVLSFADDDGALSARLAMLALVTAGMATGGIAGFLLGIALKLFWPLFLAAAFAAGWLYRAPCGPRLAARLFAIALSINAGLPTVTASELQLIVGVVGVCVLSRAIDHLLFGPLPRDAGAPPAGPATTAQWTRFALAYAAAAGLGRYWLRTALIALLVLLAYDLATAAGSGENMSALFIDRLADVSLGAILALVGTAFPHRIDGGADGDEKGFPP